ncbi:MAG: PQQ-dependent sugar dehydrogenase [bacterium]|nr:PQQ-dependent sugar dehydrogenase [bacterium]
MYQRLASLVLGAFVFVQSAMAQNDFQFTLTANDTIAWSLTSVSSPKIFAGQIPADNPPINLILGKRYAVTNLVPGLHTFQVISTTELGANIMLSEGVEFGLAEFDPDVNWVDDEAGHVEFTVSQSMLDMISLDNGVPGYQCGIHPATMRGAIRFFGNGVRIVDPIPEAIPKGKERIELQTVVEGMVSPLGVATVDDGSGLGFAYDQTGVVAVLSFGFPLGYNAVDLSSRLVTLNAAYDERGLLGLAVHPDFANHPKVYTYTSEPATGLADFTTDMGGSLPDHQSVIAEWSMDTSLMGAIDVASRREVMRIDEPQANHNGGALHFGPDGKLYISVGDGGAADDQGAGHGADGNGQNIDNVYGKILRIDVDGANSANGQYGIPADNPFVGANGLDEVFAYGFRNPYAFSFDPVTGLLYVGDVGQNDIEEIDQVFAGGNYGWRHKEGSFFFDPNGDNSGFVTTIAVEPVPAVYDPAAQYDHGEGQAVIGGPVYRGLALPSLVGHYITGDLNGRLFYLDNDGKLAEFILGNTDRPFGLFLKGFSVDDQGEVYVCASANIGPSGAGGVIYKIIAAPAENAVNANWQLYR